MTKQSVVEKKNKEKEKIGAWFVAEFCTASRFILKQLDYSLANSMRDTQFRLRPRTINHHAILILSSSSNC